MLSTSHLKRLAAAKLACFIAIACLAAAAASSKAFAQQPPATARGLVVYQDPQTKYVEVFDYLSSASVNALVTGYVLPGNSVRQVRNAGILKAIEFPLPGRPMPLAAQIQGVLADLDNFSKRFPQHATLFDNASKRFQNALSAVPLTSKAVQGPAQIAATSPSSPHPPAPIPSAAPATMTLTLKSGTRFSDAKILRAEGDHFTISHRTGVIDVRFSDLPSDLNSVPPAVQTLLKEYQEKLEVIEIEQKKVLTAEVASQANRKVPLLSDPPASPPTASTPADSFVDLWGSSPAIKGLSVGMAGAEAAKAIVEQGAGNITVGPTTYRNVSGYDILFQARGQRVGTRHGQIWTDPSDGLVTVFFFDGVLSDFLFRTSDQSPADFAQMFIDSYHVPTLKPTEFSHMQGWAYVSPKGWTLHIMSDKTVDVSRTLKRAFD